MTPRHLILFLGYGQNNLELMAQSFARRFQGKGILSIAASMAPARVHPAAQSAMEEKGMGGAWKPPLTLLDIEPFTFDLTITLGDFDQSCRPNLPGMPPHFHWDVPDPGPETTPQMVQEQLRQARDQLEERVRTLFASDLLDALFVTRRNLELILDNLLDGVMAHTTSRRIFFFNQAAEKITGHKREDILGKDCHEVFPGRFCGGDCEFCTPASPGSGKISKKQVPFVTPDGRERVLKMSTMPLADEQGQSQGAVVSFKDETELALLRGRLQHHHSLGGLVGRDPKMLEMFDTINEVAAVSVPVLVTGESGTGKELVANAIHDLSSRKDAPFVAVNCGALPEGILESELFGHKRGAFSGAVADKKGRFELAHGGTIFLDEVGELSPAMQVKLLRVLAEQKFEPVGGEKSIQVDVRVVSATNQNLKRMMEKKKFRRDLFYRLCVVPICVVPLREKRLDIPMLVEHFLEVIASEIKRPVLAPTNEALDYLTGYPWPGNIRELRNALEFAYVKCRDGILTPDHLPPEITSFTQKPRKRPGPALKLTKKDILAASEKTQGNRKQMARLLGVGRATLYRYLDLFDLK